MFCHPYSITIFIRIERKDREIKWGKKDEEAEREREKGREREEERARERKGKEGEGKEGRGRGREGRRVERKRWKTFRTEQMLSKYYHILIVYFYRYAFYKRWTTSFPLKLYMLPKALEVFLYFFMKNPR